MELTATDIRSETTSSAPTPAANRRRILQSRYLGYAACLASLFTSGILALKHTNFSGPGDELSYYAQATKLIPFVNNWYGPSYFFALRIVHDATTLSWFASGRLLAWLSACVVLLVCASLFNRLLPRNASAFALAIVALSPDFIMQSYSSLTIMYGAVWLVLPLLVLVSASAESPRSWVLVGMLFGIAALARFQSAGFVLGALGGIVLIRSPWILRIRAALLLLCAFLVPIVAWRLFLMIAQGYAPPNYNFVNLVPALGQFESFQQVPALVHKYGSMLGVLRADPLNFPRIVAYGIRATLMFPFREAPQMLALAAGWIVPGAFIALVDGKYRAPWFTALVMGLVLTGIGSMGMTYYYLPCLPLLAFAIATAIESLRERVSSTAIRINWGIVLCSVAAWAVVRVPRDFRSIDWPEWTVARNYLNAHHLAATRVVTTASSLRYDAKFAVLDQDTILPRNDSVAFVSILKTAGATHLVITERHSLGDYPWMEGLLTGSPGKTPHGLVLDTMIVSPRRVAVYHLQD